jgi:hypothetical protein
MGKPRNIFLKIITYLLIVGLFLLIIARIFYHEDLARIGRSALVQYPVVFPLIGMIVFGIFSIFQFKDIDRGEEKGGFAIYQFILFFIAFIFFGYRFFISLYKF